MSVVSQHYVRGFGQQTDLTKITELSKYGASIVKFIQYSQHLYHKVSMLRKLENSNSLCAYLEGLLQTCRAGSDPRIFKFHPVIDADVSFDSFQADPLVDCSLDLYMFMILYTI